MSKFAARTIFIIHFVWTLAIMLGTVFIFFAKWYLPWHLGIVTGTLAINLWLKHCPLTTWEENIRRKLDPAFTYHHSFTSTILQKLGINLVAPRDVIWYMAILTAFAWGAAIERWI